MLLTSATNPSAANCAVVVSNFAVSVSAEVVVEETSKVTPSIKSEIELLSLVMDTPSRVRLASAPQQRVLLL